MFNTAKSLLKKENIELQVKNNKLQIELDRLTARKDTEEKELKHLIKMKEEKAGIEFERYKMDKDRECEKAIAEVKDQYRDKMEAQLSKEATNIKEMYGQILERLPNINAKLRVGD